MNFFLVESRVEVLNHHIFIFYIDIYDSYSFDFSKFSNFEGRTIGIGSTRNGALERWRGTCNIVIHVGLRSGAI